jgi:hypothetical protein
MSKRITLGPKPGKATATTPTADQWVRDREAVEPMKRLTIDLPQSLHAKIKAACAMRGTKMVEEIRDILEQKYGKT